MIVPSAQLRVFVPVDTLDGREVARWTHRVGRTRALELEDDVARARLVTGRGGVDDAAVLVRRSGEDRFVCPLMHDLRCGLALRDLGDEVPPSVLAALVPDESLRDHLLLVASSGRRPSIIDAPWAVPLPWFALFSAAERRLTDPPEGAGPRLRYTTTARAATDRLARAIDAVDVRLEDAEEVLDALAELAGWVDAVDPRSLIELDYCGLTRVLGIEELRRDTSAAELWAALEAWERGDVAAAEAHHATLVRRWRRPQGLVVSS